MLPAQVHRVDPQKTITIEVAGATAAYSLDASLAEATADNGLVSITGNQPGTTHVVVTTPSGVQTFEVLVTTPPPHYPPGFVMPVSVAETAQSGFYEGRYYSSPAQIQNQLDFLKIHGDDRTHVHIVETNLVGPLAQGQPRIALSSASYQVVTPRRDVTLFDQYVDESPLTLNGSIVRGFHMRQDNWFVHAGYTTVAAFQGLFLPTQPELVAGGGYRRALTANSSITASFYQVQIPASDLIGHSGSIGTVSYKYSPRETFWFIANAGISHGAGGAGRLYYRTDRDNIAALVRYMPPQFASLGANSFRGLHTDFSWTRHFTNKFEVALTFYNNNLALPALRETTVSGAASLRYQLTPRWALTGGASASSFQTHVPPSLAIRSFTLPAGLAFQSQHFGASGQYQFAVTPGRESGGKQFRASMRSGWGALTFTGYAERDTNAPTLSFIFGQVAGLQQVLDQQGIRATTIQQVDELLSSNSFLIAAGYIKGATINLVPERTQIGGAADWSSRSVHRKQLSYNFLFNDNQTLLGSTQDAGHTLSYSQSVTRSDDVSLACSVLGVKNPGRSQVYTPICFIAWRHQFQHVPYFIVPERHGTITGNVFRDDQSKGVLEPGMPPMPEVDVILDNRRHTRTRADGSYRFPNVPRGKHRIVAMYRSREPSFFTTASAPEVDEDATVNFGIGYSLSGLMGQVLNDAGQGVAGITVEIRSRGLKRSVATEADGSFFVSSLVAGDYEVQVDEDSLPAGYSTDGLVEPQQVTVGASSPGKAAFTARAFRSISGRVLSYDSKAGRYVPVSRAQVSLGEPGLTAITDLMGRYLFRDLAAGSYTISVQNEAQTSTHTVRLGAQPVDLINVDFQISRPGPPDVPAPTSIPALAQLLHRQAPFQIQLAQ
jgi:Carboxypeptidase regulatory-like domain